MDKLLEAVEIKRSNDNLHQRAQVIGKAVVVYPPSSVDLAPPSSSEIIKQPENVLMISNQNTSSQEGSREDLNRLGQAKASLVTSAADLTRISTRSTSEGIQETIAVEPVPSIIEKQRQSKLPSINLLLNSASEEDRRDQQWSSSVPAPPHQIRQQSTPPVNPYQYHAPAHYNPQPIGQWHGGGGHGVASSELGLTAPRDQTPAGHVNQANPSLINGYPMQDHHQIPHGYNNGGASMYSPPQHPAQLSQVGRYPESRHQYIAGPMHQQPPPPPQQSQQQPMRYRTTINGVPVIVIQQPAQQTPQQQQPRQQYQGNNPGFHPYQRPPVADTSMMNRTSPPKPQIQVNSASSSPQMITDMAPMHATPMSDGTNSDREKDGTKAKRNRRKFDQVVRLYQCNHGTCSKSYGTLNHLNHHITLQGHGAKRTIEEFDEILMDAVDKGQARVEDLPAHLRKSVKYHKLGGRIDEKLAKIGGGGNNSSSSSKGSDDEYKK